MEQDWSVADRISGGVVDLVNAELKKMRETGTIDPLQIMLGLCLGMKSYLNTAPIDKPVTISRFEEALDDLVILAEEIE